MATKAFPWPHAAPSTLTSTSVSLVPEKIFCLASSLIDSSLRNRNFYGLVRKKFTIVLRGPRKSRVVAASGRARFSRALHATWHQLFCSTLYTCENLMWYWIYCVTKGIRLSVRSQIMMKKNRWCIQNSFIITNLNINGSAELEDRFVHYAKIVPVRRQLSEHVGALWPHWKGNLLEFAVIPPSIPFYAQGDSSGYTLAFVTPRCSAGSATVEEVKSLSTKARFWPDVSPCSVVMADIPFQFLPWWDGSRPIRHCTQYRKEEWKRKLILQLVPDITFESGISIAS